MRKGVFALYKEEHRADGICPVFLL